MSLQSPSPFLPLPRLLAVAMSFLALHFLAVWLTDNEEVSHVFLSISVVIAIFAGWRLGSHTTGALRVRWILLLTAMGIYLVALLGGRFQYLPAIRNLHYLNTFTVVTIGMALRLLAVASPPEQRKSNAVRAIDYFLTLLICALGIADLFLPLQGVHDVNVINSHNLAFTTAFKFFVAITASIALPGATSSQEYRFLRTACIFLWLDAFSILLINNILFLRFHRDHTPLDAILSAAYLGFAILALLPDGHLANPVRSIRLRYLVRSIMPLFLLLAAFALATRLAVLHLVAGLAAMGMAILAYGLRLAITQSHYMAARDHFVRQAMIDSLTQIWNRRGFDAILEDEWNRINQYPQPLALLLIDIDNFKQINDTYGHSQGDACLVAAAHCIRDQLEHTSDSVYRYGGEEFAVLLPHTGINAALSVAEKIRNAVEDLPVPGMDENKMTVSIGVAVSGGHEPSESSETMVKSADQALYHAKRAGRNRVMRAQPAYLPHITPERERGAETTP